VACILLSHRVLGPEPRYARGYGDVAFVAYHVVVFSLIRQLIAVMLAPRVGRYFGLTRTAKLERFGEQGYAFLYFFVFGAWGMVRQRYLFQKNIASKRENAAHNVPAADVVVPNRVFLDWCVFPSFSHFSEQTLLIRRC
jgi:hypothetical protein